MVTILVAGDFFVVVVVSFGRLVETFEHAEVIIIPTRSYVRLVSILLNNFLQLLCLLVALFRHEDLDLSLLLLEGAKAAWLAERENFAQGHRGERVLRLDARVSGLDLLLIEHFRVVE